MSWQTHASRAWYAQRRFHCFAVWLLSAVTEWWNDIAGSSPLQRDGSWNIERDVMSGRHVVDHETAFRTLTSTLQITLTSFHAAIIRDLL